MTDKIKVPLFDMVMCLSDAMDLISPDVSGHHERVACIAYSLSREMQLPVEQQKDMFLASILHDSGAFSLKERLQAFHFEEINPSKHAEIGYRLFKDFAPLANAASLIRYHHARWDSDAAEPEGGTIPIGSHILHLSDRVDILIDKHREILGQAKDIVAKIKTQYGKMFMPEALDAFQSLASKEYFWLNVVHQPLKDIRSHSASWELVALDIESLMELTNIFRRIIDFRSRFTATHSTGVAAAAEAIAELFGFPEQERRMMKIAGFLHDLGKLAVPEEILEKPAALSEDEFNIMRSHTFHTYRILEKIDGFKEINEWASFHHERLNGRGYPFHYTGDKLSLGARIMAVADVFTAIIEDRPYRKGMTRSEAFSTLNYMAVDSLDRDVISALLGHFDDIRDICQSAQRTSSEEYESFYAKKNEI